MLKYKADLRSIAFILLSLFCLFFLWNMGGQIPKALYIILYIVLIQMAISISTIVHNHQHFAMWKSKPMNILTDNILTVLYGFPIFAWIPTHNTNHHVHINKDPDYTKTYRVSEKNNLATLLSYPTISGYFQQPHVISYFLDLRKTNPKKFYYHLLQVICLLTWIGVALIIDWRKALWYVVIPQQVSLFVVLIFNYIQHVHADEETKFNSSRNMTGFWMNFLLMNNGLHTAHHISPGTHWSLLREKHAKIASKIHPSLNETNFIYFLVRTYIGGIFNEKFRTKSMRMARIMDQKGRPVLD